jgi:hypothetical protein
MLRRALFTGLVATFLSAPLPGRAQAPDPRTPAAVDVASRYVEKYLKELSAIVCEEHQVQTLVKADGRVSKTRTLVSDLMFVKVEDTWVPHVFRDVISVDGKPVRDRSDRLRKLFLDHPKTAVAQAQAIAKESGRYNLGFSRTGNSPLLPMLMLDPHVASRFRYALSGDTLSFDEQQRPTFLGFARNGRRGDLPARGSLAMDLAKGAIVSGTLTAEAPGAELSTTFTVKYQEEPAMKLLVPMEMTESYWLPARPKEDRLNATMTYSAFRRFRVTTSEIIK